MKRRREEANSSEEPAAKQVKPNNIISIPQDTHTLILQFACDNVDTMEQWRTICKQWNDIITTDELIVNRIFLTNFLTKHCKLLTEEETCFTCQVPIRCVIDPATGIFSSRGRLANEKESNKTSDYKLLADIGHKLFDMYNGITKVKNGIQWISMKLGAHSAFPITPIIVKYDTIHTAVEYNPAYNEDWSDEASPPYSPDEATGSLIFQTVKKMIRFIDQEQEFNNSTDRYNTDLWNYVLQPELPQYYDQEIDIECAVESYKKLKQTMEEYFEDNNVTVIKMSNLMSEEVSLYFILGKKGSYIAGFWWIVERNS
jgi:hypothetical protein